MGLGILIRMSPENGHSPGIIILNQDKMSIGRKADICMDTKKGKEVSKIHSYIHRKMHKNKEVWMIEDASSLNGTFVNGRKVRRLVLNYGDEIVFGGGSSFNLGDTVVSTTLAECRYYFYVPPPPVKFVPDIDLNKSLLASDLLEMCSICYCPVYHREVLPCGHVYCLSCIHEWSRVCTKAMKPCACPLCRSVFLESELTPDEAVITPAELKVFSIEPFLRGLSVKSCRDVKSVSIMRIWRPKQKEWFWKAYDLVSNNHIRLQMFLYLTKASLVHILRASVPELQSAVRNFDLEPEFDRIMLIHQLLKIVFEKLIPKKVFEKSVSHKNDTKFV